MKTLTDNRVAKVPGFKRATELDFSDDGTRFQGFVYKHLPISQARSCGLTFLSVRVDYLSEDTELKFVGTYEDYSKEPWYKLCDKYNGVKELPEMDEIVKDLETIFTGVKELNKKLESEEIDTKPILHRLEEECKLSQNAYDNFKSRFDLFDPRYSDYEVRNIRDYMKSLKQKAENAASYYKKVEDGLFTKRELRKLAVQTKNNYIFINDDCFYTKQLNEYLEKVAE